MKNKKKEETSRKRVKDKIANKTNKNYKVKKKRSQVLASFQLTLNALF